jgi:hypothetical protein
MSQKLSSDETILLGTASVALLLSILMAAIMFVD